MRGIVYHQAAGKYTLTRDEIQGRRAALDDIHDCVMMICQACGLDKKIRCFRIGFFGGEKGIRTLVGV